MLSEKSQVANILGFSRRVVSVIGTHLCGVVPKQPETVCKHTVVCLCCISIKPYLQTGSWLNLAHGP